MCSVQQVDSEVCVEVEDLDEQPMSNVDENLDRSPRPAVTSRLITCANGKNVSGTEFDEGEDLSTQSQDVEKGTCDDSFEVEDLPQPEPPPVGGGVDKRVFCMDLRRKCGAHDTTLRMDQKRALGDIFRGLTAAEQSSVRDIIDRIFGFLEENTHEYEDQYLCETSLFMAALLGCNTNVSHLGGMAQALNALFYLTGYLSKNPVKPNAWRTCIAAALHSAQRNESVADDKDTPTRNAKFFLQKVLNRLNALAELSDTQLSMLLLNFKSYTSSHRFTFCFPTPALEFQIAVERERDVDSLTVDDCVSDERDIDSLSVDESVIESLSVDDSVSDERDIIDSFSVDDSAAESLSVDDSEGESESVSESVPTAGDNNDIAESDSDTTESDKVTGTGCENGVDLEGEIAEALDVPSRGDMIFRTEDDKAVALSQHDLYRYRVGSWDEILPGADGMCDLAWWCVHGRGCNHPSWRRYQRNKGLHNFNLMEYASHIEVVEMPKELPTSGPCRYYFFGPGCPIRESHIQKLHSKHRIAAVSGKPPKSPGLQPVAKKTGESQLQFDKRLLTWRLKADAYARTMGAMLVPWDRKGDCQVHSYEDFVDVLRKWESDVQTLRVDRKWRNWIFRDRNRYADVEHPDPVFFPDPRPAARLMLAKNLTTNLALPKEMRKIANRWRYQHSDRFEDHDEYHECHGGGGENDNRSKVDVANALAIAALLDTVNRGTSKISGLNEETSDYVRGLARQVSALYPHRGNKDALTVPTVLPKRISARVEHDWHKQRRATDVIWAKAALREMLTRKPPEPAESLETDNDLSDDVRCDPPDNSDLYRDLNTEQKQVLRHVEQCFEANEPARILVHGGPGTGKSFLANVIMKSAKRRGLTTRFTALSGAAATVNGGTTVHYIAKLKRFCSWGRPPTSNAVKEMHERSRGQLDLHA